MARRTTIEDKEFGRKLREARRASRTTQAAIAEQLGISAQQFGKYERGENRVSIGVLRQIARILDTSVDALSGHDMTPGFRDSATGTYQPPISEDRELALIGAALRELADRLDALRRHKRQG